MLIFLENTPQAYAWGSTDALPSFLKTAPTGEPQAELWFGDHPSAPAAVAKATPTPQTLLELIDSDPKRYGVDGKHLPFLLKVLGIGAPLSLQVHPSREQAEAGFAREETAGVPLSACERNYKDNNHKPELLVALSEVTALCGFRALDQAAADLHALTAAAPAGSARSALGYAANLCSAALPATGSCEPAEGERRVRATRSTFLRWTFSEHAAAVLATEALGEVIQRGHAAVQSIHADRFDALRELTEAHPRDPGTLVSVLLHLVRLRPGEAVYLAERQLHAYLGGIAVEIMAASDNVLRAGLTKKHIDKAELMRIVDTGTLDTPHIAPNTIAPGVVEWAPEIPDFKLVRARLDTQHTARPAHDAADNSDAVWSKRHGAWEQLLHDEGSTQTVLRELRATSDAATDRVRLPAYYPMVLIVTRGRACVERLGTDIAEVANVAQGQSLYISCGEVIELSGIAEVFIATVGNSWPRVSQGSSTA